MLQFCAKYLDKIQLENSSELVILPPPIYKAVVTEFWGACGPSHSFVDGERGLKYENFLFRDELSYILHEIVA